MGKKTTKQQHLKHQKRHRIIVGLSTIVIAVLLGLVFSLIVLPQMINTTRLNRINAIYSSIKLPANIYSETDNIFGDKRPYSYDAGRSFASSKTFVVGKTVTDAFNEIDTSIKAAGYTEFGIAYPDSIVKQVYYKTDRGEYIRLSVISKSREDTYENAFLMTGKPPVDYAKLDPNAGPSTVILKVNLDDNNE